MTDYNWWEMTQHDRKGSAGFGLGVTWRLQMLLLPEIDGCHWSEQTELTPLSLCICFTYVAHWCAPVLTVSPPKWTDSWPCCLSASWSPSAAGAPPSRRRWGRRCPLWSSVRFSSSCRSPSTWTSSWLSWSPESERATSALCWLSLSFLTFDLLQGIMKVGLRSSPGLAPLLPITRYFPFLCCWNSPPWLWERLSSWPHLRLLCTALLLCRQGELRVT